MAKIDFELTLNANNMARGGRIIRPDGTVANGRKKMNPKQKKTVMKWVYISVEKEEILKKKYGEINFNAYANRLIDKDLL